MTGPFTAGEPLAPTPRPTLSASRRDPAGQPGGAPRPPRRRGNGLIRTLGRIAGLFLGLVTLVVLGAGVFAWHEYERFSADLPTLDGLRNYQPKVMSRIYAGDDRLVAELATERRIFVPYSAIPDTLKQAFISAEDKTFWTHRGIDPLAIFRAAVTDLEQMGQGRRPIGASTITQQVAKNMLLENNEVTLSRKVKEAILATRIEQTLSKERILELYLNEIYLGLGSYGVAAAAQTYFNKSLDDLTLPEAAFLAALPKAPNNYNPFRFPDAARTRRDWVLDRMAENGVITADQARVAKEQPVVTSPYRRPDTVPGADWFAEDVRRQLIDKFGADTATTGGLTVHTSLDPMLQEAADRTLRQGLMNYDHKHGGWRGPVTHLPIAGVKSDWQAALSQVARPPGMLPDWVLAVVIEENGDQARLGWLEPGQPGQPAIAHTDEMLVSDNAWARHNGAPPRRMADIAGIGDVVMARLQPPGGDAPKPGDAKAGDAKAGDAKPADAKPGGRLADARPAPRAARLMLRQIPQVQGALVTLDPHTGRVLAMSGGWSFDQSQFNRASQAQRQPGSSFKPFVYLTAMEQGISPSQRFLDGPFVEDLGREGQWRPGDYEPGYLGEVPLRIALEKSLNLVTVRLADKIGMNNVAQTAIAFHMVDSMPKVLPAALGAVDTTVLREAGAYAGLDMAGKEVVPTLIDSVQDRDGHVIWSAPGLACMGCDDPTEPPTIIDQRKQIADPQSDFQIVTMMQGVVQYGTGYEAGKGMKRAIAGKTGTTQDFKDAWFAGFTPDMVTVVWVGFDDPQPLGENETGGAISAPIWHDFMAIALKDRPVLQFTQPDGITMAAWDTGFGRRTDAFKPGQEPGASSSLLAGDQTTTASSDNTATLGVKSGPDNLDTNMGGLY
jgi:penicillin-binding protein 1A